MWRHETVHWCITLRRIPVIFKIEALGWLLNIIMNYERIPNQVTHAFGRLKKSPRTFVQVCTYSSTQGFYNLVNTSPSKQLLLYCLAVNCSFSGHDPALSVIDSSAPPTRELSQVGTGSLPREHRLSCSPKTCPHFVLIHNIPHKEHIQLSSTEHTYNRS